MDEKEKINDEIKRLKLLVQKTSNARISKESARNIIHEMESFKHTMWTDFPLSEKYYKKNSTAEIYVTDGIEHINQYGQSKLKQKDNHYFYDGTKEIIDGLNQIIRHLEQDLQHLEA